MVLWAMYAAFRTNTLVLIKYTDLNLCQSQSVPSSGDDLSIAQRKGRERQTSGLQQALGKPAGRTIYIRKRLQKSSIVLSVWHPGSRMIMSNPCVLSEGGFLGAHVAVWMMLSNSR